MRNKLKQIGQLAKIALFFTLFSVNLYLACLYLKPIPETEYVSGMFLGVFILQLLFSFLFIISDLWLHNNTIRMIAVIILVVAGLTNFGYYLYSIGHIEHILYDKNGKRIPFESFMGIFWLTQSCVFIYLLLAIGISHLIRRIKLLTKQEI